MTGPGAGTDPTIAAYEAGADRWVAARGAPARVDAARALAGRVARTAPGPAVVADLGCGPGWHLSALAGTGALVVGVDASAAMASLARRNGGGPVVRAGLRALPFRPGALAGAWAQRSHVHLDRPDLPGALAELHAATSVGAEVELVVFGGDTDLVTVDDDELPGRRFSAWRPDHLRDVVVGAGFDVEDLSVEPGRVDHLVVRARRLRTLADTVGPGMRLLVCGINPSLHAADRGVGFTGPANRFWGAAVAAGLVTVPADARAALAHHRVGMTDLAKRASARADEVATDELVEGAARVERLVAWLRPGAVCVVGLAAWRAAVDRRAAEGVQPRPFGGRPVYVMGSTSGRNAHTTMEACAAHLRAAAALADR